LIGNKFKNIYLDYDKELNRASYSNGC